MKTTTEIKAERSFLFKELRVSGKYSSQRHKNKKSYQRKAKSGKAAQQQWL
jgi:hypothetical protein